jgi:hypothetical protein
MTEQQSKWAIGWLDALLFQQEERRWGGTALTINGSVGCSRACLGQALDVTCGVEITSNASGAQLLVISRLRVSRPPRAARREQHLNPSTRDTKLLSFLPSSPPSL